MRISRVESPKGSLINNAMIIEGKQNKSREYFHGSNGIWRRVDGFDFLQLIPFLDALFPAYLFCPIFEIDSFRGEWTDRLVPMFLHAI